MIPILRTLTRKSKLGFGKFADYTVQELLDLKRYKDLISPYYKLTSINYIDDILEELKITGEYIIEKPSADKEKYYVFLKENGYKKPTRNRYGSNVMKTERKTLTRSQLKFNNQNR